MIYWAREVGEGGRIFGHGGGILGQGGDILDHVGLVLVLLLVLLLLWWGLREGVARRGCANVAQSFARQIARLRVTFC